MNRWQHGIGHIEAGMPQATFWFAHPFRDWVGRRTVPVSWEGPVTLRQLLERLAAEYPAFRANVTAGDLRQETFNHMAAVIVDGNFLSLDSPIPDGATIDVLTPLAGGVRAPRQDAGRRLCEKTAQ
jgi:molybdopterin converting factor small subunit